MKTWHKLAALLIVILAGLYVVLFLRSGIASYLPSIGGNSGQQSRITQLENELSTAIAQQEAYNAQQARMDGLARHFFEVGTSSNEVQKLVEGLAFKVGLNYSVLRSVPSRLDEEALIHYEEVNISGNVDYMNLVKFMREVENHDPLLEWSNCTISPRRRAEEPNVVFVSGRIRAKVLSPRGAEILAGNVVEELP